MSALLYRSIGSTLEDERSDISSVICHSYAVRRELKYCSSPGSRPLTEFKAFEENRKTRSLSTFLGVTTLYCIEVRSLGQRAQTGNISGTLFITVLIFSFFF